MIVSMQKPKRIPYTKEGYDKIFFDIEQLNKTRAEVLVRLQTAREMGDLSENGAYKAAKWELGGIDRELRRLTYLSRVAFVKASSQNESITFGSTVTLETGGKVVTYQFVNVYESNPAQHKISTDSPIGAELMGKSVGDEVHINVPAGIVTYTVKAIS
jgi:transcription elongation factor GreA